MTDSAALARQLAELDTAATEGQLDDDTQDKNGQIVVTGKHIEIATFWHHSVGEIEKEMHANAALYVTLRNNLPAILRALCVMAAVKELGPTMAGVYPSAVPLLNRRADELLAELGAKNA